MDQAEPLPRRLRRRPVWKGHVVPYVTYLRDDGTPDFRVLDNARNAECLQHRRCGICGDPMPEGTWLVFIGGPLSIKNRTFADPPMHEECARFAAKTCPYLSDPEARHRTGDRPDVTRETILIGNPAATDDAVRPDRMGMYYCKEFVVRRWPPTPIVVAHNHPKRIVWDAMPQRRVSP